MRNTSNKEKKKTDFAILGREPVIMYNIMKSCWTLCSNKITLPGTSCASCLCCIAFTDFVCTNGAALRYGGLLYKSQNVISPDISKKDEYHRVDQWNVKKYYYSLLEKYR